MKPYTIETRDVNGKREIHEFETREDFYAWALDMDDEILLITYGQSILYSSLVHPAIDWDELVAYLA